MLREGQQPAGTTGGRPDADAAATAKERNEGANHRDLHARDGGEEGGGEGLQACHRAVAERPLCLFPGGRCFPAGCTRGQSLGH